MTEALKSVSNLSLETVLIALVGMIAAIFIIYWIDRLLEKLLAGNKKLSASTCDKIRICIILVLFLIAITVLLFIVGTQSTPAILLFVLLSTLITYAGKSNISNISAGIVIKWKRMISEGNFLTIGGYKGFVSKVGLSNVVIRTLQGEDVVVPNQTIINSTYCICNKDMPYRLSVKLPVNKNADPETAKKVLIDAAKDIPHLIPGKKIHVGLDSISWGTPYYEVLIWCDSLYIRDVNFEYSEKAFIALREAGISS